MCRRCLEKISLAAWPYVVGVEFVELPGSRLPPELERWSARRFSAEGRPALDREFAELLPVVAAAFDQWAGALRGIGDRPLSQCAGAVVAGVLAAIIHRDDSAASLEGIKLLATFDGLSLGEWPGNYIAGEFRAEQCLREFHRAGAAVEGASSAA